MDRVHHGIRAEPGTDIRTARNHSEDPAIDEHSKPERQERVQPGNGWVGLEDHRLVLDEQLAENVHRPNRRRVASAEDEAYVPGPIRSSIRDGLRPSVPVPAGGMTTDRVPEMLDFYGADVMLLIGGALLEAREQLTEATAAFVAKVRGHAYG